MERIIEKNEIANLKEHFELLVEDKPWIKYDNIFETYTDDFYLLHIIVTNEYKQIELSFPIHKVYYVQERSEKTMETMKKTMLMILQSNNFFEPLRKFMV